MGYFLYVLADDFNYPGMVLDHKSEKELREMFYNHAKSWNKIDDDGNDIFEVYPEYFGESEHGEPVELVGKKSLKKYIDNMDIEIILSQIILVFEGKQ